VEPDARLFLLKARESLASAEADLKAGRFNSAANRAYYAAFQAAVAMLVEHGIRPRAHAWDHRFVISQFSGKLVKGRKVVTAQFAGTLDRLLKTRLVADYRLVSVSRSDAKESVGETKRLIEEIIRQLEG